MKDLDIIRGLSGITVFVSHYFQIFILPVFGWSLGTRFMVDISSFAVVAFFVLSGYLISMSIDGNLKRNTVFNPTDYVLKRVFRIWPPLIFSICLTFLIYQIILYFNLHGSVSYFSTIDIGPLPRESFVFSHIEALGSLLQTYAFAKGTYLQANGPLWSLSYEVGFYLILFAFCSILFCAPGRKVNGLSIAGIGLLIFLSHSVFKHSKWMFLFYFLIFSFGIVAYIWQRLKFKNKVVITLFILSIFAVTLRLNVTVWSELVFGFLLFIYLLLRPKRVINTPTFLSFFCDSSKSTYSLYILHFPLMLLGFSFFHLRAEVSRIEFVTLTVVWSLFVYVSINKLAKFLENRELFLGLVQKFNFKENSKWLFSKNR